jgi:hypothetical protein
MFDFDGFSDRSGNWTFGVGEVIYVDPGSESRREDLRIEDNVRHFAGDDVCFDTKLIEPWC